MLTSNQIAYFRAQEEARHNAELEAQGRTGLVETNRHNIETERTANYVASINNTHYMRQDAEAQRHNLSVERETNRSNLQNESETRRHNYATESINANILAETNRHNMVFEAQQERSLDEARRHNIEAERIGMSQASASQLGSTAALQSAYAAQESANASMRNALTNEYSANTARSDMYTRMYQLQDTRRQTDIKQQQANTQRYNAETSRFSAQEQAKRWQRQSINETKLLPYQQAELASRTAKQGVQAVKDVINTIFQNYGGR